MLTLLSRLFRRNSRRDFAAAAAWLATAPQLQLAEGGVDRDIPIALAVPAAAAFVAGQGARIYSLDAFRRERLHPRTPRAA